LNDYKFINDKILEYDIDLRGGTILTYNDYIKYIYKELRKTYRNEYVYKNTFLNEIIIKNYGLKDSNVINEFRVGNSIADLVMFNGTSKAFEIKTELDSNKRLSNQLLDYKKIFKQSYIITHEHLKDKYLEEDADAGIIILKENPRSLKMEEVRPAKVNKTICPRTLMRIVRTQEYKNIVISYYGYLPKMNSFNMFEVCEKLITKIPNDLLNKLFIEELKKRKTNTKNLKVYQKELTQLSLAMNLGEKKYSKLVEALNQPIKY
tara:strand:+ start:2865 stop:3653 length:789 start_codon:yes stop_codon:yes gene_type:complete